MAKYSLDKKGRQRWRTNKTDSPTMQWTVQGEAMNNHQHRLGTKIKAGSHKCKCPMCVGTTKEIKDKILKDEFKKEVKDIFLK